VRYLLQKNQGWLGLEGILGGEMYSRNRRPALL